MRFKSAVVKDFKRFTHLTIQGIPERARLIMLAGPNGSGKSSFFEALHTWHKWTSRKNPSWEPEYHVKAGRPDRGRWDTNVAAVEFHGAAPEVAQKTIYIRSAYRNDPQFRITQLARQGDPLATTTVAKMIDNEAAVGRNYQRLAGQGVDDLFRGGSTTFDEYLERKIGKIRQPLHRLFPSLTLEGLGNPLENGTFYFTKGASTGFDYRNLSGGEKAAFDLILDLVVASQSYDDTLFCIDEPESHMNARLQAELLSVLYELIPSNCQMILATHSIGMMRRARDLESADPGSVVFLDFGGRDFDEAQVIEPTVPDVEFWQRAYDVALADLAALIAPERVVICEGAPNASARRNQAHDARCYERIFRFEFPETKFVPGGNDLEVAGDERGIAYALGILTRGTEVLRLIDRDARSDEEVAELKRRGVRVLSRRNLESCLFDDAVLEALALSVGSLQDAEALLAAKENVRAERLDDAPDDLEPASGQIYVECRRVLELPRPGNDVKTFMRDTLAPLVKPGMIVYEELKRDIFEQQEKLVDEH